MDRRPAVRVGLPAGPADGPDSWWIGTTLLSAGTGVGYGTTVGLIAAVVAGAAWRWRSALAASPRAARRPPALLVALPLLIGSYAAPAPRPVAPVAAAEVANCSHVYRRT